MENWDRFVARFCTVTTVPVAWGRTEWLERAHMEGIRSVFEAHWDLRGGSFKKSCHWLSLVSDVLNESHKGTS